MRLTNAMHAALTAASKQPLRRTWTDTPGKPAWPAPAASLHALTRHQLIAHTTILNRHEQKVELWTITDQGKTFLNPPVLHLVQQPKFLNPRSGYTTVPARSVDTTRDQWGTRALESVDAPESYVRAGRVEHLAAQDRRVVARRLARGMRAA
jgi:hypothetical protein